MVTCFLKKLTRGTNSNNLGLLTRFKSSAQEIICYWSPGSIVTTKASKKTKVDWWSREFSQLKRTSTFTLLIMIFHRCLITIKNNWWPNLFSIKMVILTQPQLWGFKSRFQHPISRKAQFSKLIRRETHSIICEPRSNVNTL